MIQPNPDDDILTFSKHMVARNNLPTLRGCDLRSTAPIETEIKPTDDLYDELVIYYMKKKL